MHGLKVFGLMEGYGSNISEVLYGLGIGGIWDMPIGFTAQQGDRYNSGALPCWAQRTILYSNTFHFAALSNAIFNAMYCMLHWMLYWGLLYRNFWDYDRV